MRAPVPDVYARRRFHLVDYLSFFKRSGLHPRTMSRYLSSIRTFYRYLVDEGLCAGNPTVNLGTPKIVKNPPEYLTLEEVEILLGMPDQSTPLGLRDRTIIELLYSCGLRVSEAAGLTAACVNFHERCLLVYGKGRKERIVPFGKKAEELLENYVERARPQLPKKTIEDALFLNFRGEPLDRKGI